MLKDSFIQKSKVDWRMVTILYIIFQSLSRLLDQEDNGGVKLCDSTIVITKKISNEKIDDFQNHIALLICNLDFIRV